MKIVRTLFTVLIIFVTGTTAQAAEPDLIRLVEVGDLAGVDRLLAKGDVDLEVRSRFGDTALLLAARRGELEIFDRLTKAGANIDAFDAKKRDVLNISISVGNPELTRRALKAGIDPTKVTSIYEGSALIFASAEGAVEIVEMLIAAGAPLDRVNNIGWTALLEAVILGDGGVRYQRITTALLAAGADKTIADRTGKTPLDIARARGYSELVKLLEK